MKSGPLELPQGIDPLALIEAAMESFLVTTTDLEYPGPTILYANPAFEEMTGWSRAEIVGKSPRVLQGPNTDKVVFAELAATLARGETWEGQAANYRRDGSEFVMEWSIAPVRDAHGKTYLYLAVQRDVTERVEAEAELRRAREAVVEGLKNRALMRETFGKFVPNAILDRVLAQSGNLEPDLREATIFYSDIVGFSTLTEHMNPGEILRFLNEYFSLVTEPIERRNGVIHQFQGDAILATFNLPLRDEQHALNAVEAAIDVQDIVRSHRFGDGFEAATRIGVNTGRVVAGTVGSAGRLGYTVHGDAVNLTARIENENKRFGTDILVGDATVGRIAEKIAFESVETIKVRGRQQPVTLYRVVT
jgi:PAS domain S-box-containing protein